MRRSIVLSLIAAAVAVSCSKKKDDEEAGKPAETPPVDKGTPGEVADETPPEPNPATPSAPPTAPPVSVDCEKLFTVEDVAKACGASAADWEVKKQPMENGQGATTCLRMAGPKKNRVASLLFALNSAPGSPDGARALLDLSKEGARPVEGVGDGAYLHVREEAATRQTIHHLEAIKGALWFKLGYEVRKGDRKPLCTDDGLTELARVIAGRLP
ncbi:MAG TPA: hypothetical protein VFU21_05255 [Kofleriaceae bacterium]|nr:hypothetical protein [Kofleriaceae bacterium]